MKKIIVLLIASVGVIGCRGVHRLMGDEKPESKMVTTQPIGNPKPGTLPILNILVAGQSNAVSAQNGGNDSGISTTGMVSIVWEGKEYFPTASNPVNQSIAWVRMGDMIAKKTGRKVRIINVSVGGTMSGQWVGDGSNNGLVNDMIVSIRNYQISFIVWVQGEADTTDRIPTDDVYQNYKTIISQCSNIPFYVALDGYPPPQSGYPDTDDPVRLAQKKIIADGIGLQGVDVDQMRLDGVGMDADRVHFQGTGLDQMALRWFTLLSDAHAF